MKENSIAKRYARALILSLQDEAEYRQVEGELRSFQQLLRRNDSLRIGMETFLIPREGKREILAMIAAESRLHPKTSGFLRTIADENRVPLFPLMLDQLEGLWHERSGIEKVTVLSSVPLSDDQQRHLADNLSRACGKRILVQNTVDPTLLAGIRIKRGSVEYDFSLAGNLKTLKESLINGEK